MCGQAAIDRGDGRIAGYTAGQRDNDSARHHDRSLRLLPARFGFEESSVYARIPKVVQPRDSVLRQVAEKESWMSRIPAQGHNDGCEHE